MPGTPLLDRTRSPHAAILIFVVFVLVSGFATYAWSTWREVRAATHGELGFLHRLLIQTTNEVFSHHQSVLRILGERLLEIDAGSFPERGRELVNQMLRLNPAMAGFGLARADGQLVLVSGVGPGVTLPNLLQQATTVESFRRVLATGRMLSGRSYFLPLLERWVAPIRVAIRDAAGAVPLVMTAGIDLSSSGATWNAIELPPGTSARILRPDGYWQLVLPTRPKARVATYDQPADPAWIRALGEARRLQSPSDEPFAVGDDLVTGAYLPAWDLYTLISRPRALMVDRFRDRMRIPTALFAVFMLIGLMSYRISARQQRDYEERLVRQAHFDHLTDLPNRLLALDRLRQALGFARRRDSMVAVIYLDLDNFKRINDSAGHLVGDKLLTHCAQRLRRLVQPGDTVARLGGDEFLIVLPQVRGNLQAETTAAAVRQVFDRPFLISGREIVITCSIGVAMYPQDGEDGEELLRASDTALYKAKEIGRNVHCFFSDEMNQEAERRMALEAALRQAMREQEFSVVYQPQVRLADNVWVGCEALLRWHSRELGEVGPTEFIPIAEESGQIVEIGNYVLRKVCADLVAMQAAAGGGFHASINVSAGQLRTPEWPLLIRRCLQEHGVDAGSIELEITEGLLVESGEQLRRLHDLGLRIALDDFGTGFSSLGYLQEFPVTTLKIDQTFVKNIEGDLRDQRLAAAIINLANTLHLQVVAEGIESAPQADFLRASGCLVGQGFYLSRPIARDALCDQLMAQRPSAVG
ncbi:MAG: EAL domain-containing protein [Gammaproteobacteria bacterium]|nr:EAL domain-containing protein [Gammaproteobacteria bacterium]